MSHHEPLLMRDVAVMLGYAPSLEGVDRNARRKALRRLRALEREYGTVLVFGKKNEHKWTTLATLRDGAPGLRLHDSEIDRLKEQVVLLQEQVDTLYAIAARVRRIVDPNRTQEWPSINLHDINDARDPHANAHLFEGVGEASSRDAGEWDRRGKEPTDAHNCPG